LRVWGEENKGGEFKEINFSNSRGSKGGIRLSYWGIIGSLSSLETSSVMAIICFHSLHLLPSKYFLSQL
jgi:hypothetical protein